MYQLAIRQFAHTLKNLDTILGKAVSHAEAKKFDVNNFCTSRVFPDMLPFPVQIRIATDQAKSAAANLSGKEAPKHEDTEKTFEELKARIAKTIAFIDGIKAAQVDGSEEKDILMKLQGRDVTFKGMQYLLGFAYPNFYFHVTTAYDILRHNGVELSKRDFVGTP